MSFPAPDSADNRARNLWLGRLPIRTHNNDAKISRKVFLGGIPLDLTESELVKQLACYGTVEVQQTEGSSQHPRYRHSGTEAISLVYVS